jgi:hypothetical protein
VGAGDYDRSADGLTVFADQAVSVARAQKAAAIILKTIR